MPRATWHSFFFDVIGHDSERVPLETDSMMGPVPLVATAVAGAATLVTLLVVMQTVGNVLNIRGFLRSILPSFVESGHSGVPSLVKRDRLAAILHSYAFSLSGQQHEVSYPPSVSINRMFGGNSNSRGPIWIPQHGGQLCFEKVPVGTASETHEGKVA